MCEGKPKPLDLIWGLENIAKEIGLTINATYPKIKAGQIPARKVGDRWVIDRSVLRRFFGVDDD